MSIRASYDTDNLEDSGWGLIIPINSDSNQVSRRLSDLEPLIKWRQYLTKERYKQLEYRPDETAEAFLARHGLRQGISDPERLPYYLLIAASPEEIPFGFQIGMGASHAIGRLWFENPRDFAGYAHQLVESETREGSIEHSAVFFGPVNPDDSDSTFIVHKILRPLFKRIKSEKNNWGLKLVTEEQATKERLSRIMLEKRFPLLVTLGHGAAFPPEHSRQHINQGGIVCQDWPGPKASDGELLEEHLFTGADIPADADLYGMICFHMSDYSLGTPQRSEAQSMLFEDIPELARQPFISSLPQAQLAHGALATVGLTDKFWNIGFPNMQLFTRDTTVVAESCLRNLLGGTTIGVAMQPFRQRATELDSQLIYLREEAQFGKSVDSQELVTTWATLSTLNNLLIFGDPAVRLVPSRELPSP